MFVGRISLLLSILTQNRYYNHDILGRIHLAQHWADRLRGIPRYTNIALFKHFSYPILEKHLFADCTSAGPEVNLRR